MLLPTGFDADSIGRPWPEYPISPRVSERTDCPIRLKGQRNDGPTLTRPCQLSSQSSVGQRYVD